MAFGKKKDDAPEAVAEDSSEAPEEAAAPDADAPLDADGLDAALAPADEASAEAPAAEAPAAAAPNSDALLSMFQESKEETSDLSVLVDLAGEADLDDILEELRTIRAALGITDAFDEEADFAAAA